MEDILPVPQPKANRPCPSPDSYVDSQTGLDPKKRKPPASGIFVPSKKLKSGESTDRCFQSSSNAWQLSAEIWQHVFAFLPPKMLGRLLSVNKCFHFLLNPSPTHSHHAQFPVLPRLLATLKPEVIWQLSRRRFWAAMPTPLRGHTELQMWQLACHNRCQFCGTIGRMNLDATCDPLKDQHKHAGPRPIWPFALRSCGPCLLDRTIKEVDLLLSSSVPSCLIPALPFIFIDDSMHIIPSAVLQTGRATLELTVTKLFLSSHVTAIQEEFTSVRAMGEATAGEWIKGLEGRGKEHRAESLRWEKFEVSGGINQMRRRLCHNSTTANNASNEAVKESMPLMAANPFERQGSSIELSKTFDTQKLPAISPQTAEVMKAARRREIEKRARELEPPLPAHVLALIPSFKAAVQITSPLDDTAWSLLKRLLMAQRQDIDPKQHQSQMVSALSQVTTTKTANPQGVQELTLEAKQKVDKAWDDAQAPLRARIAALADKFIRDSWANCRTGLGKEQSERFAAEVLLYVRKKFYASVESEDAVARATGKEPLRDSPNGPFTRKLTLENMKWVFDVKVKPFTEEFGKDLFYCSSCYKESFKLYSFEGVIQHYAAKHTRCLSLGNAVVHWRAEWPKIPPFHPKPYTVRKPEAEFPKRKINERLELLTIAHQEQPHRYEAQMPIYSHPTSSHIHYEGPQIQPPHDQFHPYIPSWPNYAYPLHGQALPDYCESLPAGPIRQFQPSFFHGGGSHLDTEDSYQNHSYIPYRSHTTPELHSSHYFQPSDTDDEKLEEIARNSREIWLTMAPLQEIRRSIKVFVMIHHVCARFQTRFSELLPLHLFVDGLYTKDGMRPVRKANGLQCKVCCLGLGTTSDTHRHEEFYNLGQLAKHFNQRHCQQQHAIGAPVFNWCTDMIYLPPHTLSESGSIARINPDQLGLIQGALPGTWSNIGTVIANDRIFDPPTPLPTRRKQKLQVTSSRNNVTRCAGENISRRAKSSSKFAKINVSGTRGKSSLLKPIRQSKANIDTDSRSDSRVNSPSIHEPPKHAGDDEDEDDSFDLIAGLESQLDQQALSPCPNTPIRRDS
ncbi:hypothetical protein F5B22DRAFT_657237 [Xylaria bambusicola]|uniref:uncharacterized protein n=1 Tax=Xylaria bambusicola TaxID=326684 RepID=UPI00200863C5|nr:uncharacterized protein F5B22DRAFT_657237 [Xylaria bambusicola]KAI0526107.1 hypothetical protein F5B22DRAFT_657237 [Xylaria bambusicola]